MDAIEAAYLSAMDRLGPVSLDDFRSAVARCEVHPVEVAGETAGAIVVRGAEVHACVMPWAHGRWFNKAMAGILNSVIRRHGYAYTTATTEAGRRFVQRLGFKPSGDGYRKETRYGH